MSMVTKIELLDILKFSTSLINCKESFKKEFKVLTCDCSQKSINWLMFSVGLWQEHTIGLIPNGFLWILFKIISALIWSFFEVDKIHTCF